VAAEQDIIGKHDMIANVAIVPNMRADHQETVIADLGHAAAVLGSGIRRHILRMSQSAPITSFVGAPR